MQNYSAELAEAGLPFIDMAILVHGFDFNHVKRLPKTMSFEDLGSVAVEMIEARGTPFAFVSGPLRSGPRSFVENARQIDKVCHWLAKPDKPHDYSMSVFYQLVFQIEIHRIRDTVYIDREDKFISDLCEKFSRPILTHPLLKAMIIMPGWHKSIGSRREFEIYRSRKYDRSIPVLFANKLPIPGFVQA